MTAPKPLISVKGSTVVWKQGGTTRRHHTGSHDEAISLAARLDEAWDTEVRARRAVYDRALARGGDVVRYPDDTPAAPAPDPLPDPEPEPVDTIDVTVDVAWDPTDERVALTFDTTGDVTLWRSIGGRSSSFDVTGGETLHRTFKAVAGDLLEIRVDGPNGDLVTSGTFGEDYSPGG